MAQRPTRFCSNCGTPLATGQRFCANCGTATDFDINKPTEQGPTNATGLGAVPMAPTTQVTSPGASTPPLAQDVAPQLTPPPPPDAYIADPYNSPPQPSQGYQPPVLGSQPPPGKLSSQGYQASSGYQPSAGSFQAAPDFARPQRRRGSCLLTTVLLVIVLLATGGYFAYRAFIAKNSSSQTQTSQSSNVGSNNNNVSTNTSNSTPASVSAKTVTFSKPLSFIYDDVQISITDVKQAENFSDDANPGAQSGVLRIDLKEKNTYSDYSSYYPTQAFNLLSPDGTTAQPTAANQSDAMQGDVSRTDWVDFAITTNADVSALKLQVGKSTEEQITVPLKANADLSKYQPKVVSPNQQTQYAGTTWTITQAEASLSFQGKQADAGKMFVTVSFRIDNNSSADFIGLPSDYIRLQSGQTTVAPTNNNVPVSFPAQQTGQTATTTFVMPQGSTDFTVILRASNNKSVDTPATQQATIPFQIK
jgi:hypothetical protein